MDRSWVATWWENNGSAAEAANPRLRSGVLGRKRVITALLEEDEEEAAEDEVVGMPQKV